MFFNYINSLAVLKVITHAPLSLPPGLTSIKEQRSVGSDIVLPGGNLSM
jgi:hypothetical protein